jgi:uncharacterized protein YjbJ (UPF0337 family)
MKWDLVEGKWSQLSGSAIQRWGKLSADDLQQISGKREQLVMKVEEAYGITRREADKQVWDWGKTVGHIAKKVA